MSAVGSSPLSRSCQTCQTNNKTYTCVQCNDLAFCDGCWEKWVLHAPGATGWGGKPHEKADPFVLQRLRNILEPVRSEEEHAVELEDDRETTWFGFSLSSSGQPIFQDFRRFAAIVNESYISNSADRFPQLVSFVGETGAGKSTIIKLLIDRQDLETPGPAKYCSPVTSSKNDRVPTTGDVHLYADPSTFLSSSPLLFADCEGLNGGEALPKGLRARSKSRNRLTSDRSSLKPLDRSSTPVVDRQLLKSVHGSQRSIAWAQSPLTRKREYAIQNLYPKILYTFSDAVVFVLRNPRSFESTVLDTLLCWGAALLDMSLNQPVLPHAIIVLNATEEVDEQEWDVAEATKILMETISQAVLREPNLERYVKSWKERGKIIKNTDDLLACYYASVAVVRIPVRGSYTLMDSQASKLADLVRSKCAASHLMKKKVRMLANAERMHVYLQSAYDHFTRDLDSPFDFVKEALRHSPVPRNFGGNILSLAIAIKDCCKSQSIREDARQIFVSLSPMVASCVMFDAARQHLLGTADQLFADAYAELCVSALFSFADLHWPCEFRKASPQKDSVRCCNVKLTHEKGHQDCDGKGIGQGSYESQFDPQTFQHTFRKLTCDHLSKLQNSAYEIGKKLRGRTDPQIAAILHRERIIDFYSSFGNVSDFVSHSACFSCLRELPECLLRCGHILCLSCIQAYGRKNSRTSIELKRCPLHVRETMSSICIPPARYHGKGAINLGGVSGHVSHPSFL
ncbi:hypothetical protein F5Y15DRAFT_428961 [Xylariaceae sp. FL0016]|nr:hypothetical protein F5Y15DRAFT_428961 [Xylariaceae sp. FL0016]